MFCQYITNAKNTSKVVLYEARVLKQSEKRLKNDGTRWSGNKSALFLHTVGKHSLRWGHESG